MQLLGRHGPKSTTLQKAQAGNPLGSAWQPGVPDTGVLVARMQVLGTVRPAAARVPQHRQDSTEGCQQSTVGVVA